MGDAVDAGELLGQPNRMVERELEDAAADLHLRRWAASSVIATIASRNGNVDGIVNHSGRVDRQHHVLADPHRFESGGLGVLGNLHCDIGICAGAEVHRVHPDFHGAP